MPLYTLFTWSPFGLIFCEVQGWSRITRKRWTKLYNCKECDKRHHLWQYTQLAISGSWINICSALYTVYLWRLVFSLSVFLRQWLWEWKLRDGWQLATSAVEGGLSYICLATHGILISLQILKDPWEIFNSMSLQGCIYDSVSFKV